MKLKGAYSLEGGYDQPRQHIKKQRHYFVNKGLSSQGYGFSSSHLWVWELDYKESWAPKNWCFWTVVLEKFLESPLDWKEFQSVNPKGNQSWIFIGRTNAEAETLILWHLMGRTDLLEKSLMLGKIEGRRRRGWQRMRWHHQLDGYEFEFVMGQGGLVCCIPWGRKELDMSEPLNWKYILILTNRCICMHIVYKCIFICAFLFTF